MQTHLSNALGIIGGFITLGYFFDSILITKSAKQKIHRFLTRKHVSKSAGELFLDYVRIINESFFGRFFTAHKVSLKYFALCVFISILSVFLILVLQIGAFGPGGIFKIKFSNAQIAILAVCVAFNCIIDWISIAQTQLFFSISAKQTTPSRSLLLIASDFILTINFFTLLYAQIIAYLVIALTFQSDTYEVNVRVQDEGIIQEAQLKRKNANELHGLDLSKPIYSTYFFVELKNVATGAKGVTAFRFMSSGQNYSLADIIPTISTLFSAKISNSESYFISGQTEEDDEEDEEQADKLNAKKDDLKEKPSKIAIAVRGDEKWKELNSKLGTSERQSFLLEIPAWSAAWNRSLSYTAAYRSVDELQDGFPASVLSGPSFISLQDLIVEYYGQLARTIPAAVTTRICRDPLSLDQCLIVAAAKPEIWRLTHRLKVLSSPSNLYVPSNTLMLTSLTATVLIYAFAVFLLLSKVISTQLIKQLAGVEKIFLRSPFACAGFVIGIATFVLTWIF